MDSASSTTGNSTLASTRKRSKLKMVPTLQKIYDLSIAISICAGNGERGARFVFTVPVVAGEPLMNGLERRGLVLPVRGAAGVVEMPAGTLARMGVSVDDEVSFDEPWLDTASCTTCDDCMGINKMMFAYNDDKQAYLTDPAAGTYEDLVRAAEICPAKCIHPGKPLNPNEPNLEELMARAAPFN